MGCNYVTSVHTIYDIYYILLNQSSQLSSLGRVTSVYYFNTMLYYGSVVFMLVVMIIYVPWVNYKHMEKL